jgi:hypothetical protein
MHFLVPISATMVAVALLLSSGIIVFQQQKLPNCDAAVVGAVCSSAMQQQ